MSPMTVLIAGGAGFIGINLVKTFAERGHEVISLDIRPADELHTRFVKQWAGQVTFAQGDALRKQDLDKAAAGRKITHIINSITDNAAKEDAATLRTMLEVNVMAKVSLLELATRLQVKRFLSVSSINVYGYRPQAYEFLNEEVTPAPTGAVHSTNILGEQITRRYGELGKFETVNVRMSSTYGPMERDSGFKSALSIGQEWTGKVVNGEPVQVGNRAVGLQWSYAKDIAAGMVALMEAPGLAHDTYNLATPRWWTIGEAVAGLQAARPSVKIVDDPSVKYARWKPRSLCPVMDVNRIFTDIGFAPRFDLASGFKDLIEWRESFPYKAYGPGR